MSGLPSDTSGTALQATRSQRWLARLSFALAFLAVAVVVAFAGLKSVAMLGVGLAAAAVSLATAFLVLSRRGVLRWLSLAVFVLAPITVIIVYAFAGLLWLAAVSAAGLAPRWPDGARGADQGTGWIGGCLSSRRRRPGIRS